MTFEVRAYRMDVWGHTERRLEYLIMKQPIYVPGWRPRSKRADPTVIRSWFLRWITPT